MYRLSIAPARAFSSRLALAGLFLLSFACVDDTADPAGPSTAADVPADAAQAPVDAVEPLELDATASAIDQRTSLAGIVFATAGMRNADLNKVHTGWKNGGALDPKNILSWLSGARAKGGRAVVKLSKGSDRFVTNGDGTFSLSKWKSLVGAYRNVNLGPYIEDGTIVGHMLIDEPHRAAKWGGKAISHATLEEMAKYSKQLWPRMPTLVRVVPSWLAQARFSYKYVDAGWAQYTAGKGDPRKWVESEAAAAKREGLGLVIGLNVTDGGNGSSKIRGESSGRWAMSATELRSYGAAMLSSSHACAFVMRSYDESYYDRSDITRAMAELSVKAKGHTRTSCQG
jgi:hypothetical protein